MIGYNEGDLATLIFEKGIYGFMEHFAQSKLCIYLSLFGLNARWIFYWIIFGFLFIFDNQPVYGIYIYHKLFNFITYFSLKSSISFWNSYHLPFHQLFASLSQISHFSLTYYPHSSYYYPPILPKNHRSKIYSHGWY